MNDDERGKEAPFPADDENAIRALHARLCDAWARGDGNAYGACFTEHSDYITFTGLHLRGRTENAERHGDLFRGPLKGTKLSAEIIHLELLSPSVALAHCFGNGPNKSYQTYVFVKSGSDWLIKAFQNTRVQPSDHA